MSTSLPPVFNPEWCLDVVSEMNAVWNEFRCGERFLTCLSPAGTTVRYAAAEDDAAPHRQQQDQEQPQRVSVSDTPSGCEQEMNVSRQLHKSTGASPRASATATTTSAFIAAARASIAAVSETSGRTSTTAAASSMHADAAEAVSTDDAVGLGGDTDECAPLPCGNCENTETSTQRRRASLGVAFVVDLKMSPPRGGTPLKSPNGSRSTAGSGSPLGSRHVNGAAISEAADAAVSPPQSSPARHRASSCVEGRGPSLTPRPRPAPLALTCTLDLSPSRNGCGGGARGSFARDRDGLPPLSPVGPLTARRRSFAQVGFEQELRATEQPGLLLTIASAGEELVVAPEEAAQQVGEKDSCGDGDGAADTVVAETALPNAPTSVPPAALPRYSAFLRDQTTLGDASGLSSCLTEQDTRLSAPDAITAAPASPSVSPSASPQSRPSPVPRAPPPTALRDGDQNAAGASSMKRPRFASHSGVPVRVEDAADAARRLMGSSGSPSSRHGSACGGDRTEPISCIPRQSADAGPLGTVGHLEHESVARRNTDVDGRASVDGDLPQDGPAAAHGSPLGVRQHKDVNAGSISPPTPPSVDDAARMVVPHCWCDRRSASHSASPTAPSGGMVRVSLRGISQRRSVSRHAAESSRVACDNATTVALFPPTDAAAVPEAESLADMPSAEAEAFIVPPADPGELDEMARVDPTSTFEQGVNLQDADGRTTFRGSSGDMREQGGNSRDEAAEPSGPTTLSAPLSPVLIASAAVTTAVVRELDLPPPRASVANIAGMRRARSDETVDCSEQQQQIVIIPTGENPTSPAEHHSSGTTAIVRDFALPPNPHSEGVDDAAAPPSPSPAVDASAILTSGCVGDDGFEGNEGCDAPGDNASAAELDMSVDLASSYRPSGAAPSAAAAANLSAICDISCLSEPLVQNRQTMDRPGRPRISQPHSETLQTLTTTEDAAFAALLDSAATHTDATTSTHMRNRQEVSSTALGFVGASFDGASGEALVTGNNSSTSMHGGTASGAGGDAALRKVQFKVQAALRAHRGRVNLGYFIAAAKSLQDQQDGENAAVALPAAAASTASAARGASASATMAARSRVGAGATLQNPFTRGSAAPAARGDDTMHDERRLATAPLKPADTAPPSSSRSTPQPPAPPRPNGPASGAVWMISPPRHARPAAPQPPEGHEATMELVRSAWISRTLHELTGREMVYFLHHSGEKDIPQTKVGRIAVISDLLCEQMRPPGAARWKDPSKS